MKSVIFDLDGTLADTSGDLIAAANACFRELGFDDILDPEHDQRTAVLGGRAMLRLGYERLGVVQDSNSVDENYQLLLKAYARDIDRHTMLYPGCVRAVTALGRSGIGVGVCTNKPEALAEDLLEKLGVRGLFGPVIGADTLPVSKPDPAPLWAAIDRLGGDRGTSVLVGDSVTDRETARGAGAKSLLVTFGPDGRGVEKLAPDALLHHYDDLAKVVAELFG